MDKTMCQFGFTCEITTLNGMLVYGPYKISKGSKSKDMRVEPPPVFRSVIFDIFQEYIFYSGKLNIEHTIAYIHFDAPKPIDLVCLDTAMLEPEHKIDTKRAILPAKYNLFPGHQIDGKTFFFGDVYNSVIHAEWSNSQPLKLMNKESAPPHWSQYAGFVDLEFSVTREKNKIYFDGSFTVRRHLFGETTGLVPVPPFPGENEIPKHAVVAGQWSLDKQDNLKLSLSDAAYSNLKNLGQLLEYRGSQTIWVHGDPGSGKEVFAQALHSGSVVSRNKTLRTRSVAGVKLDEFKQRLFGSQIGESCLIEEVDQGGTLFLDEFDKLDKDNVKAICSNLLRVLEADEYIREVTDGVGRKNESAAKIGEVNWIFAGAFSTLKASSIPKDFWSRLTGTLTISHPVKGGRRYAASLFIYFYTLEAVQRLGPRHGVFMSSFLGLQEKPAEERQYNEQITANVIGLLNEHLEPNERILPSDQLMKFANRFAKRICVGDEKDGERDIIDSSRGIRQAAKAAFFHMRQAAIEGGDLFDFDEASKLALEAAYEMLATSRGVIDHMEDAKTDREETVSSTRKRNTRKKKAVPRKKTVKKPSRSK